MPTLKMLDSFAHQVTGLYTNVTGSPAFSTGTVRGSDPASLHLSSTSAACSLDEPHYAASAITWAGFALRVHSITSGDYELVTLNGATVANAPLTIAVGAVSGFRFRPYSGSTLGVDSADFAFDTWYWVEMIGDMSSTTWHTNYRVGPIGGAIVDQTGVTSTQTGADTSAYCTIGSPFAATWDVYMSAFAVGTATSTTDWLGEQVSRAYSPTSVGTHVLDASPSTCFFKQVSGVNTALTTAETTSYQTIDDLPLSADSDAIRITGSPTATKYAEYGFAQEATLIPSAVRAVVALDNETSGSSTWIAKLHGSGGDQDIYNATVSSTTKTYQSKFFVTQPNSSTSWTNAAINGTKIRFGFTTSVAAIPRLEAALLEIVAPSTAQTARPVADVSAGSWTQSTGGSLFGTIDEVSADDTDFDTSSLSPTSDEFKVRLGALSNPNTTTGHAVHYRFQKNVASGDRIDLTVTLYAANGTTAIASWTETDIQATITQQDRTLTAAQAGSIPAADYATGLVLGFKAVKV